MHASIRSRPQLALLFLGAVLILLLLPSMSRTAQAGDCHPTLIKCIEKELQIDLEVEGKFPDSVIFSGRYLIYWNDGLCQYRQVVIVAIYDIKALNEIMTPLGSNQWNAMGQIALEAYEKAIAKGVLKELSAEPVEVECNDLKDDPLPPCELPWGPIVIDPIPWPDEDILLYSGLEPVANPQFCFSYNLDGPPILDPVKAIRVPFFFTAEEDIGKVADLLRQK